MKRLALLLMLAATAGGVTGCGHSAPSAAQEAAQQAFKAREQAREHQEDEVIHGDVCLAHPHSLECEHPAEAEAQWQEYQREHPAAAKAQEEEANG